MEKKKVWFKKNNNNKPEGGMGPQALLFTSPPDLQVAVAAVAAVESCFI